MSLYGVLVRPVITEKSTGLAGRGKYVFEVARGVSKMRVKEAVEAVFGVRVVQVNVMNVRGKVKRFGRRPNQLPSWKKAVVTLYAGDKIDLFGSM